MAELTVNTNDNVCVSGDDYDVMSVPGDGGDLAADPPAAKAPADSAEVQAGPVDEMAGKDPARQKIVECATKENQAYEACVDEHELRDEVACSPKDKPEVRIYDRNGKDLGVVLEPGEKARVKDVHGREVDCREYRRFGDAGGSQGRTHTDGHSNATTWGESDTRSGGGRVDFGPFSASGTETHGKSTTDSYGDSRSDSTSNTESRPEQHGWEKTCQERRDDAYYSCISG